MQAVGLTDHPLTTPVSALTSDGAQALIRVGVERATVSKLAVAVVVVDHTSTPLAMVRMDGANQLTAGLALGKARLCAANGTPTRVWRELVAADAFLGLTLPSILTRLTEGAVMFGGGYPIRVDGHLVGGLGVSGASEPDDDDIARQALSALQAADQFSPQDT